MSDPQKDQSIETQRKGKLKAEQEEILAKDKERKAIYLAKEQKIAKVQDARENQRLEDSQRKSSKRNLLCSRKSNL
jgi:hypothetical protein